MTVKIIERGFDYRTDEHTITCNRCHTRFKFLREDAIERFSQSESYLAISCPVCGTNVTKNV